ncbi:MAG: S-adenosylmethionine:tRNA ribosyltransferase-isomerase [Flavobacteriales bacterium]|nr:S-adenosylmethionine:tRNA ribosyltransferase-isomerase [Flavobacteriales bacterium]
MKEQVQQISIDQFDFELPEHQIAFKPTEERSQSRLLVYNQGDISHGSFPDIVSWINQDDLVVFNNTRVIHARMVFKKPTGAQIEIFCLEPVSPGNHEEALASIATCEWTCYVGNAKKWKEGWVHAKHLGSDLKAEMLGRMGDAFRVRFSWGSGMPFAELLNEAGKLPLPPYIKREATDEDELRYQTVYAEYRGSVAAPTAGLHFTREIMAELAAKGVQQEFVTLHVGAGTFKPVGSETIGGHEMHREVFHVSQELIDRLINSKGKVVAVGTTSLRALESVYWVGVKLVLGLNQPFDIDQWTPYEGLPKIDRVEALLALKNEVALHGSLQCSTAIVVLPGYTFHIISALITNFHLPKSTLLLLVAALIGEDWKKVYQAALNSGYRFLSYGDSSILIPR